MQYWGAQVQIGETSTLTIPDQKAVHISLVSLTERDTDTGSGSLVFVYLHCDKKKTLLASLDPKCVRNLNLDVVLSEEFQLSHTSKGGPVCFHGYTGDNPTSSPGVAPCPSKQDGNTDGRSFICKECKRPFVSALALKSHSQSLHPKINSGHVDIIPLKSVLSRSQKAKGSQVNTKLDINFNVKGATWLSGEVRNMIMKREKKQINKNGVIVIQLTMIGTHEVNIEMALVKLQKIIDSALTAVQELHKRSKMAKRKRT